MFSIPDYYGTVSLALSEVLDDLAVNKRMVLKTRRKALLTETVRTMMDRLSGVPKTTYYLGSQSEATSTFGMNSDADILMCCYNCTVIQDWSQWTPGVRNLLMIQNDTTSPGYCLLQVLRQDAPLPLTRGDGNRFVKDEYGRVLCKNTYFHGTFWLRDRFQLQGPATTVRSRSCDIDYVCAFPCKSWPESARQTVDNRSAQEWPTPKMRRYARTTECFVVPVGSKINENEQYEWRISTSLAERFLMFSLNITQIRCYVLLKMIVKSCINPNNEQYISSYMCKTVLFHCIKTTDSRNWKESSILSCLTHCLSILNECIFCGNCPHFFISGNNLMAGKFSRKVKYYLHGRISNLIASKVAQLLGIQMDHLGLRLQIKLNITNLVQHHLPLMNSQNVLRSGKLASNISGLVSSCIHHLSFYSFLNVQDMSEILLYLIMWHRHGNILGQTSCRLIAPLFCTSLGTLLASADIRNNFTISPKTLALLSAGLNSDVSSGRLKVASILYCIGDLRKTAIILKDIEERYNTAVVAPVCRCYDCTDLLSPEKNGFCITAHTDDSPEINHIAAFCVTFCRDEILCTPHELQYEMFRSTRDDLIHRNILTKWMNFALVDSLPFLYFLQYKTYGNLQRFAEQQQALSKLMRVNETEPNFGHRETTLNLLGQCMEQENRPTDALHCYMISGNIRARNNAASLHICMLIQRMLSQ